MDSPKPTPDLKRLPPSLRKRLQKYAQIMGCTEDQAFEGLMTSILDMMENPGQCKPGGFAEEARKRLHGK